MIRKMWEMLKASLFVCGINNLTNYIKYGIIIKRMYEGERVMDKNTKNALINLSLIGATIGLGMYTQNIDWNPTIRTAAHFLGATAVPGFSSAFSSIAIGAYEEIKTRGLQKKMEKLNQKLEKTKDMSKKQKLEKKLENFRETYGISDENIEYHINPKIRNTIMKSSMILGGVRIHSFFCCMGKLAIFAITSITVATIYSRYSRSLNRYGNNWKR